MDRIYTLVFGTSSIFFYLLRSSETIVQLEADHKEKENKIEDLNHQLKTATTKSHEFETKFSEISKELALKVKEIQGILIYD